MKNLLFILLIFNHCAFSQNAKKELNTAKNYTQTHSVDKKAKARIQLGNKYNNKYINKYQYHNNNQTLFCESRQGRRNHCNVETRYGVNFIRQLSNASCNNHWGYDQSGIWVDNGCRAEFSINYSWDQAGAEGNILICESLRYKRNYCSAYLNGRDVFIQRQLSNSSCLNNWGYDRNGVWVTNGCRAEFVVEDRNYNFTNDIVVCSSRDLRFQGCQADTRGGVEFVRQLSRASCNGNWGYDRQGIWVNNGCRAKFKLLPYQDYNSRYRSQNTVISCSSKNHRRKVCPADTSGGVRLLKQKSRASCNRNWGYGQNHIWVDNGCRATFELSPNHSNRGYRNNDGYGNNNNYGNQRVNRVVCESINYRKNTCNIPRGSKVELTRQLSSSSCQGAWGYNRNQIWVANGCRAEFSVY